jgi:hypothetical protein
VAETEKEPQKPTYRFYNDEHALARRSHTSGGEIFSTNAKQWEPDRGWIDFTHRAIPLTREQAAEMAGGDEYLDLPTVYGIPRPSAPERADAENDPHYAAVEALREGETYEVARGATGPIMVRRTKERSW